MSIQNNAENVRSAELKGAREQRKYIKAHIMNLGLDEFEAECRNNKWDRQIAVSVYSSRLIAFINASAKRYNARPGGLQGKKAKKAGKK